MEKAVRAAIQRHMRGWAPYPHVRVVPTEGGHRVDWYPQDDLLNKERMVRIETEGVPSKSSFVMKRSTGERQWSRDDSHMMEHNKKTSTLEHWLQAPPTSSIYKLNADECKEALAHTYAAFEQFEEANALLALVRQQGFSVKTSLHTSLDVLSQGRCAYSELDAYDKIRMATRVLLGHAMDSELPVWSCQFGHVKGPWNELAIAIWPDDKQWHISVASRKEPLLYSDYRFVKDANERLQFVDKLEEDSHRHLRIGRGSVERFYKSYYREMRLVLIHLNSLQQLLSTAIPVVDADSTWVQPLAAGLPEEWQQGEFSVEYYSFARAFEEKAFQCLSVHRNTAEGERLYACMSVSKTLEEPTQSMEEWEKRLAIWQQAMLGNTASSYPVDSNLFESIGL